MQRQNPNPYQQQNQQHQQVQQFSSQEYSHSSQEQHQEQRISRTEQHVQRSQVTTQRQGQSSSPVSLDVPRWGRRPISGKFARLGGIHTVDLESPLSPSNFRWMAEGSRTKHLIIKLVPLLLWPWYHSFLAGRI